jgi:hypothetical protein
MNNLFSISEESLDLNLRFELKNQIICDVFVVDLRDVESIETTDRIETSLNLSIFIIKH